MVRVRARQRDMLHSEEGLQKMESLVIDTADFAACYVAAEDELEIGGMRYDVACHRRVGSKVLCQVLADPHERRLLSMQRKHASEKERISRRFSFWHAIFCQSPDEFKIWEPALAAFNFHKPINESTKCDAPVGNESPPPECTPSWHSNIS